MATYLTTEQILERQRRTAAADAKAASDPASVTEEDLAHISPETLRSVMNSGGLTHLGIGAPRGSSSKRRP